MANTVKLEGKGQMPLGGGPAPQTPQPPIPGAGFTAIKAAQAVVGNTSTTEKDNCMDIKR